jgi:hypothetical protein
MIHVKHMFHNDIESQPTTIKFYLYIRHYQSKNHGSMVHSLVVKMIVNTTGATATNM